MISQNMNKLKVPFVFLLFTPLVACNKYENVPIEQHFWVPNTFSPNNDGLNEVFYITPAYGVDVKEFELTIFDQNLKVLHSFSDDFSDPAWDGKSNGIEAPQGVYEYQILYNASTDSVNYADYCTKSTIMLIREDQ